MTSKMRVLFDVLGAPRESGGMREHATQVIRAWIAAHPADEVIVLGPDWVGTEFGAATVSHVRWDNDRVVSRATGQVLVTGVLGWHRKVDTVISLSPIVTPFSSSRTTVCFQHDWRHLKNPHEFGAAQKLYRRLWVASANWATHTVCISQKTAAETRAVAPRSRISVIENGRDHAASWQPVARPDDGIRRIVTFGHHNNKRPEIVIEAIGQLDLPDVELTVLGASGAYRDELLHLAASLGVVDRVRFPGFVPEDEYRRVLQSSNVIVMASSDEGFGLPIVEAEALGIPAVVASDSGIDAIHQGVIVGEASAAGIAAAIIDGLNGPSVGTDREPHGWADVVEQLRKLVLESPDAAA